MYHPLFLHPALLIMLYVYLYLPLVSEPRFFFLCMDAYVKTHLNLHRDLHSYLLGEQEDNDANQPVNNNNNNNPPPGHQNNNNPAPAVGEGLHAAHQAILQQGGPVGFQPYHRPLRFPFRVRKLCIRQFIHRAIISVTTIIILSFVKPCLPRPLVQLLVKSLKYIKSTFLQYCRKKIIK